MDIAQMNWTAVAVGTLAAFVLGLVWFSPKMFGRAWARGSHDIRPPAAPPFLAMGMMFAGLALLALVVGMTETAMALWTAIGAILAVAVTVAAMDLFSQKSGTATLIDAGYILASGVLMIASQGLL